MHPDTLPKNTYMFNVNELTGVKKREKPSTDE
jgi:hypothetical protein